MDEAAAFLNEVSPPLCCRMFSLHVLDAKRALRGWRVTFECVGHSGRCVRLQSQKFPHTFRLSSMERIQFPGYMLVVKTIKLIYNRFTNKVDVLVGGARLVCLHRVLCSPTEKDHKLFGEIDYLNGSVRPPIYLMGFVRHVIWNVTNYFVTYSKLDHFTSSKMQAKE